MGKPLCLAWLFLATLIIPFHVSAAVDFSAGGFLKVHGLLGDIGAGRDLWGDQELYIPQIPLTTRPAGDSNRTHLHARASRLWLQARSNDSSLGPVEVLVEGDLFKVHHSYRPRLRHAFVMVGRLQVGQAWSTFVNTAALADLDAGTAVGNSVTRTHVLRWTQTLSNGFDLQVALESPLNRLHYAGESGFVRSSRGRPQDLALRLDMRPDWGSLSLGSVWREISVDDPLRNARDTRHGTAFSLAGRIDTQGLDNLRFMFNHGSGLARHATLGTYADAVVEPDGTLEPNTVSSALLAWQHFWTPQWRSTLAWSASITDLPPSAHPNLTRKASSAHLNLIWTPDLRHSVGVEYLYGRREVKDGRNGELQRLQLTWRMNF